VRTPYGQSGRFARLRVGSVKLALSHPTHQLITPAVGRFV
jgi:hypothetical protein